MVGFFIRSSPSPKPRLCLKQRKREDRRHNAHAKGLIERKDFTPQFSYIEVKEIFHKKAEIFFETDKEALSG